MTKQVDAATPAYPEEFSSETLYSFLRNRPGLERSARILVAFSGGSDSTALLHATAALRERIVPALIALHADHGLHVESGVWREHCIAQCRALEVQCITVKLAIPDTAPFGLEAAARTARYAWFADVMHDGDYLLTAHHADDQAETVLLQLLRGAGSRGLAAMPDAKPFGRGTMLRPLLACPRAALTAYARRQGLRWIEDPANTDLRYDRSYLRRRIIPAIRDRWPGATGAISRSARHCAAAERLLDDLAGLDRVRCAVPSPGARLPAANALALPRLRELTNDRIANALRGWIQDTGARPPSTPKLTEAIRQLVRLPGTGGCVQWADAVLRRYRDELYLLDGDIRPPGPVSVPWNPDRPLDLPQLGLRLSVRVTSAGGISPQALRDSHLTVRWRQGGERCRPAGCRHRKQLKKLYQERGVPPWEREQIPLVYLGEELLAVPGVTVCEPFAAAPGQAGVDIVMESLVATSVESRGTLW